MCRINRIANRFYKSAIEAKNKMYFTLVLTNFETTVFWAFGVCRFNLISKKLVLVNIDNKIWEHNKIAWRINSISNTQWGFKVKPTIIYFLKILEGDFVGPFKHAKSVKLCEEWMELRVVTMRPQWRLKMKATIDTKVSQYL